MSINKPVYINPAQGGGTALPTPYVSGQYLTSDGTTLSWAANGMGDLLANGTVPLTADWNVGAFSLTAKNFTASPTLSGEALTNVAGWTAAGNWTYAALTGWSHATGSATALTATGETAIVAGTKYEITMNITTTVAGGGLAVSLGGQTFAAVSTGAPTTYTYNVTAISTAALAITPTSGTWVGSLTISVKIKTAATGILTADGITLSSGQIITPLGNSAYPVITSPLDLTTGLYWGSGPALMWASGGSTATYWAMDYSGIRLGIRTLGFGSATANDLTLGRDGAASLQLGVDATSAPVAQTIKGADAITTSNLAGGDFTMAAGRSTGSANGGTVYIDTSPAGGAGAGANALVHRVAVDSTGTTTIGSTSGAGTLSVAGANSQTTQIKQATVVVTTTAANTATATNLIPAGSMVIGVTTRNTLAITGTLTSYSIGDGTDVDRWGLNVPLDLNATTSLVNCTVTTPAIYAAATSVVLTGTGGDFAADKTIRVTVHYISLTAPTT